MKKIWSNLLWTGLSVFSVASISIGAYFIVSNAKKNEANSIQTTNVASTPVTQENLKQFSQNNSFKVNLQANFVNGSSFPVSQGTAWSWYYNQTNQGFEWYLMTNFHVLNEPVNYLNQISSINYQKPWITTVPLHNNYFFSLQKWTLKSASQGLYKTFLGDLSQGDVTSDDYVNNGQIKSISLITDNNKQIDLFSNSIMGNNHYNLDIGLIKIVFNNRPSFLNNQVIKNPYQEWLNNGNFTQNGDQYYIAGNPSADNSAKQLIYQLVDRSNFREKWISFAGEKDPYLSQITEPVYSANIPYENWPLLAGASGSCVYLINSIDANNINLINYLPYGIYWGGQSIKTNQPNPPFFPAFIPFISQWYNIYQNFQSVLNQI